MHATMRIALLGVAAGVQFGLSLRQLAGHEYRPTWVAVAAFATLALVTATAAVWVVRGKPLPRTVVALGTVVSLTAASAATAVVPEGGHFGAPDWAVGLVGWHLVLLLLDRVPVLLAALGTHLVVSAGQFALAGAPGRAEVGAAGIVALGTVSMQLAVVVITRMLVRRTGQAMAVAAERDRLTTRVLYAEQWEREQRTVFAGQLGATLPLLADLADGVLDPATRARGGGVPSPRPSSAGCSPRTTRCQIRWCTRSPRASTWRNGAVSRCRSRSAARPWRCPPRSAAT